MIVEHKGTWVIVPSSPSTFTSWVKEKYDDNARTPDDTDSIIQSVVMTDAWNQLVASIKLTKNEPKLAKKTFADDIK
jgi:hypothetical protein